MTGDNNVPKGEITFTADLSPEGLLGPVGRDSLSHPAEKIRLVLGTHSQKSQKAAHNYFFFFMHSQKSAHSHFAEKIEYGTDMFRMWA